MSFAACLAKLRTEGVIDAERADRFGREFDRLRAAHNKTMGEIAANDLASREALSALEFEAISNRRQKLLQVGVQSSIIKRLVDHLKGGGKAGQFAISLFDHHEAVPGVANISDRAGALKSIAWTQMGDFLRRFERNLLGQIRNAPQMGNIVRELHGEKTGDAEAALLAKAFTDTAETLRQMFNAAGGHIGKLARWALPQAHDSIAIAKAGLEPWRDFIKEHIAADQMIDSATGAPFTADALDDVLGDIWRQITSEGLDKLEPGQMIGSKMANRRADSRFFVFKNADSWMAYQERFGTGDAFNAIVGHIEGMTRDIAAMQVLGPNPGLTVRWLGDILRKDAMPTLDGGQTVKFERKAGKAARETDRMWRMYTGELTMPDPSGRGTARYFSGLRNWNTASDLGGAYLSAVTTDPVFLGTTARFNGLPITQTLADYARLFNPADPAARDAAAAAGLAINEMTTRAERLWREDSGVNVHEMTRRLADGVMRGTLLSPHTKAAKAALGVSFMQSWARHVGTKFDALDTGIKLGLKRYGISPEEWEVIRATPLTEQAGFTMLRPGDVASRTDIASSDADALAIKLAEMIIAETKFGVPGESLRAQTMLAGGGKGSLFQRGTVTGELMHSMTQFKGYSVIALMTQWQRAMFGQGAMSRTGYALTLPLFLTFGGVATVVLKAIWDGKQPPPLDDPTTWARGLVQGGGAGMLGDFIQAGVGGQSRTGGTILGWAAGPTLSNVVDPAIALTLGNIGDAAKGKNTNIGKEAARMFEHNVPGSNAWYLRAGVSRLIFDRLDEIADPDVRHAQRRMIKRAKDQRSAYIWAPGETAAEGFSNYENYMGSEQ